MSRTETGKLAGVTLSIALLVASCGGGGTEDTTAAPDAPATTATAETTTAAPAESTTTTTSAPEGAGNQSSGAANLATVTIDGQEYQFDAEMSIVGRCDADFFGAFWMIAAAADGSDASLEMFIVPEGNTNHDETSRLNVNLKDAEGRDWNADADGGQGVTAGTSQIDSFTIDGTTVTGTASFVDIYAGDGATAQGTFTATCP